jgi:hypothetical protein
MSRTLLLLALALGSQARASAPAFPLKTAEGGRFLVDRKGTPFLVVGDSAWSLIVQPREADIDSYLDDRKKRGLNLPWHSLVPERGHAVVTKGYGKDTATALTARTADGKLAVTYVPSTGVRPRELTVDLGTFSGAVTARWDNPAEGSYRAITDVALPNRGRHTFRTPGDNGTKAND